MKLIIDIPDWKYKSIEEGIEASKRCGVIGTDPDVHEAIYKGIPYEERPKGEWGKWIIAEIQCPNCFEYFETDCYSTEELNKCPICGADMRKPNYLKKQLDGNPELQ